MTSRLILARTVPPAVRARAEAEFDTTLIADPAAGPEEILAVCLERRAEALFLTSTVPLPGTIIARLPAEMKIVATCSVGFDHVDVAAAKARGLIATNTPDVLTDCTADMAFLLLLGACRRAHEYEALMRKGWRQKFGLDEFLGIRASGKTLGIVGLGRIGRAVAQRARGFGMRILYHDAVRLPEALEQGATYFPDLRAMLPHCQILTLHAPGGAATDRLINAETIALLPKGAVVVNAARGSLIDEDALIAALRSGHLYAAGLDVYRSEPDFDLRLAELPNLFLMPHMGSGTIETRTAMGMRALDNIAAVLGGRPAIDPLWS